MKQLFLSILTLISILTFSQSENNAQNLVFERPKLATFFQSDINNFASLRGTKLNVCLKSKK